MDFLKVSGKSIVDESGNSIFLRGTCIGGWMNLEDFINAYPGTETGIRKHMIQVLGSSKSELFFDCMTDNFFGEADIAFIASTGANCIRLPLNYRHFESDLEPFKYNEKAFKRLENIVDICEKYGVYAIIDMHAAQGWQNCHWHSDNERGASMLWGHPHFQDRLVSLWEAIAKRLEGKASVAGYELLNEPSTGNPNGEHPFDFYSNFKPDWDCINKLYRRLTFAIREIDKRHIIFLEGDNYGRLFSGFEEPFADNLVYSSHNYTAPGFGPGEYPGYFGSPEGKIYWDKNRHKLELEIQEGTKFANKYNVPLLVGEFGSQYHGGKEDIPYRLKSMKDQLEVYAEAGLHWTTWTYKDAGIMGWVMLDDKSEYMKIVEPVQEMKRYLGAENFVAQYWECPGREKSRELAEMILNTSVNLGLNLNDTAYTFNYAALTGFAAAMLQPSYAKRFANMNKTDIIRVMGAFKFENCKINEKYIDVLKTTFGK
jgi:Endoglucanase